MVAGFSPICDILLICWGNSAKLFLSEKENTYTMASTLSLHAWDKKKKKTLILEPAICYGMYKF